MLLTQYVSVALFVWLHFSTKKSYDYSILFMTPSDCTIQYRLSHDKQNKSNNNNKSAVRIT